MDTLVSTTPLSYRQILWRSIKLYKISFLRVILLSCFMSVIIFIPRLLSLIIGEDIFLNLNLLNWHRVWAFVVELAAMIFFIGIVWRMHCVVHGKKEALWEDFKVGFNKFIAVFVASILGSVLFIAVLAAVIGLQILLHEENILFNHHLLGMFITFAIFLLQVGIILYSLTLFIFLVPLIAVENKHVFAALEKSVELAWNHWWRIFSVQFTPWFIYLIAMLVVHYLLHINVHIYFIDHSEHTLLTTITQMVLFALYMPWVAALMIVQLNDLEIRNQLMKPQVSKSERKVRGKR